MSSKRIAKSSKLLDQLRADPSKVLSGKQPGVLCRRINPRPLFRVESFENGERLAVKKSRLNYRLLEAQMSCVSEIGLVNVFVPAHYGFCQDSTGSFFEIWEWIDEDLPTDACSDGFYSSFLDSCLVRFARSSGRIGVMQTSVFPNDALTLFQKVFDEEYRSLAEQYQAGSKSSLEVLSKASEAWKSSRFRKALQTMPRTFVHTDIRRANIRSRFLIDYSNSKFDIRILEVARFVNLNFDFPSLTHKYASCPWLPFGASESALSSLEIEFFEQVVFMDFACIYAWARKQLQSEDFRSEWAKEFLNNASENLLESVGSI